MKSWKKIAAMALSLGLVLGLTACGGDESTDATGDAAGGEKETLVMATEDVYKRQGGTRPGNY